MTGSPGLRAALLAGVALVAIVAAVAITQVNTTALDSRHCLMVMDATSLFCIVWFADIQLTPPSSSCLLGTYLSGKRRGDRQ